MESQRSVSLYSRIGREDIFESSIREILVSAGDTARGVGMCCRGGDVHKW